MGVVLLIKTDQSEALVGVADHKEPIDIHKWLAGNKLSLTLNSKVEEILGKNKLEFKDISGIVFFAGPGSFTGLRIGSSVANTLAYSLKVPIVAVGGDDWQAKGLASIKNGDNDQIAKIHYGNEPNITKPRK